MFSILSSFVAGCYLHGVAGCCSAHPTAIYATWKCYHHSLVWRRLSCSLLPCFGIHWPSGLSLFPHGLPGENTARQFQRGQTHCLQHVDFLCSLGGLCPSLHQLSGEVLHAHGNLCHTGFELRTAGLHLCTKVLYNSNKIREEHKETLDVKKWKMLKRFCACVAVGFEMKCRNEINFNLRLKDEVPLLSTRCKCCAVHATLGYWLYWGKKSHLCFDFTKTYTY